MSILQNGENKDKIDDTATTPPPPPSRSQRRVTAVASTPSRRRWKREGGVVPCDDPLCATETTTKAKAAANEENVSIPAVLWTIIWLVNNVAVTLLNKAMFAQFDFTYPYFLSFVHMCCNYVGAEIVLRCSESRWTGSSADDEGGGRYRAVDGATEKGYDDEICRACCSPIFHGMSRRKLDTNEKVKVAIYSMLFSLTVALGNVSLRHVSVNFNQVMRSTIPAVAIVLGAFVGKVTSFNRKVAVIPVMVGAAMACVGDISYDFIGFVYTSASVALTALKAVATGEILTGELALHPIDLLAKMTPYAAIQCFVLSMATGEIQAITTAWKDDGSATLSSPVLRAIFLTGIFAFALNVSSFIANKLTCPLTASIAATVKQVLMIGLSTLLFNTEVSVLNGLGISVTLVGSGIYSYVASTEKNSTSKINKKVKEEEMSLCENGTYLAEVTEDDEPFVATLRVKQ